MKDTLEIINRIRAEGVIGKFAIGGALTCTVVIDTEHENHLNLDFLVLGWNADGKEAARVTQRLDRKLSQADVDQIRSRGITYLNSLTLEPGEYNVHIVIRDNLKGNLGSVATQWKVDEQFS